MNKNIKLLSKYFAPTLKDSHISDQVQSKSAELLERAGYIRKSSAGVYNFLPLGDIVLTKLTEFIDQVMEEHFAATKLRLSHLQPTALWNRTGRNDLIGEEMFRIENNDTLLAPTHEEEITSLVASSVNSYRQLPLRLYQIGVKFRNEARPLGGLLRCREFIMKDLYTFDKSLEEAKNTYEEVCQVYSLIFDRLGLQYHQVVASSGAIGGSHSHEFHLESSTGQDTIKFCNSCGFKGNEEVFSASSSTSTEICPKCSASTLISKKGLEIGHTFLLGTKYSKTFDAKFKTQDGQESFMEMGCYGIGVSRLLAAIVEASHDRYGIIWPNFISPYTSYIIPISSDYSTHLNQISVKYPSLLDDRQNLSFSRKFKDALLSGIPNIFVLGSRLNQSGIELHQRISSDINANGTKLVNETEFIV